MNALTRTSETAWRGFQFSTSWWRLGTPYISNEWQPLHATRAVSAMTFLFNDTDEEINTIRFGRLREYHPTVLKI